MGTVELWPLALVLSTLGGLLLLLRAGPRLFRGTRPVSVSGFRCPLTHERVDVEFQVTAWAGERVAATRCSAFTPATAITCERRCLGPRAGLAGILAAALLAGAASARAGDVVGSVRLEGPPLAFRLPAVPPGPHTLAVWHELLGRLSAPVTVGPDGEVTVEFVFPAPPPTGAR